MPNPARPKTGSKAKRRAPFEINGVSAPAGRTTEVELPVARLPTGMWLALPVAVLHGAKPGPTIWLSAAIHGDELNGVPIIRHVLERLDPKRLSGTVLAAPVINVFGLVQESRYLPDRRDLNRCFPGSRRGSAASRLAHLFMTEIVSRCEHGIDLHTGSGGRTNLPQIRCNLDSPRTADLAKRFAPPVIVHSGLRDGSLRAAAAELGKTVLLYEAGEASRFNSGAIAKGVEGIMRVMQALGMHTEETAQPQKEPKVSRTSAWSRAQRSGFCEMVARLGDEVETNDRLAVVFDALGRDHAVVRAKHAGLVIGHVTAPIVHRGDAVAHVAALESS